MKTIHFFGCSYTAGHELPDDELLPWKKDCKTIEEYYINFTKRGHSIDLDLYISVCKSMAYPSIIEKDNSEWKCVNHADFGASIKQQIFKAATLIENNTDSIDFLVFQVTHFTREFVLTNQEKLENFSINFPIGNSTEFNAYLEKSVMFHSANHWCFHGLLDLLMFQGYLRSKNIKHIFVDFESLVDSSVDHLRDIWKLKTVDVYNLQQHLNTRPRLLAGHYDIVCHNNLAKIIADKIKEII